jgi:LysR family transcriptional regulator, mexEF-oprN operon transcriptional activator
LNSDINMTDNKALDLNLLRVFKTLMSELNATRAAARLGLSQAAVSAALNRLRLAYGDPLFERTQRGLRPTPKAIVMAPQIDEALAIVESTLGQTGDGGLSAARVVRLGLSDDFEIAFGPEIIDRVHRERPDVRLVFRQTNSLMAVEALNAREIDLSLTAGGFSDSRIKHRSLGASHYLVVFDPLSRGHCEPFTTEEYVAREHILISYSGLTGITDDMLSEYKLTRKVRAATTHFSAVPFLLQGTQALATMPSHAARALAATGRFSTSPTPLPFPEYAFGLSWRFDAARDPAVKAVRDLITTFFSENRS